MALNPLFSLGIRLLFLPAFICHSQSISESKDSADVTLSPYFWVKSEEGATLTLPLKSTSAKVAIAGVIADVKVAQVYKNEGKKPIEAIYVFPGSTRAAVYGMRMTLGERIVVAKIRTKEQARADYEEAKQLGKSASLLEQHRPNVFQMNVANIMPGDEIKVELSYTELLVPTEGTYSFVYPTVVGPRYSNTPVSQVRPSEKWVANPYTTEGVAPLNTFDLEVCLAAGMPIARMACDTHKTGISYDGPQNALLKLDPTETQGGNRDFVLKYQLAGGRIQSGLLLTKGAEENFFLLMVQPPKQVQAVNIPPREYVFIMDVSGSMNGYPLETSKALMRKLVKTLRPQDRFNFMAFEGAATVWSPSGSKPATEENLQSALAFVGSQSGGGGTEILSAMKKALALPRIEGMSRSFVISTDGFIRVEPAVLDLVRANLNGANMFAFGIGSSVNRFLIEGIAHAGMGEPFVVAKPEDAPAMAERFRKYVSSPVLTQIQVAFKGFEAYDVEPLTVPDVLSERPVICFGKWKGKATGTVELMGTTGTGAYRQSFNVGDVRPSDTNSALKYLWARHRIQLLGDYAGLGNAEGQRKAITDLGLQYGLLTDYTSFIAIDSIVRNTTGNTEKITQPLPLPQGVSNLAIRGGSSAVTQYCINGASIANRGGRASTTVEVVACAASTAIETESVFPASRKASRLQKVRTVTSSTSLRLQTIGADRSGLPLPGISTFLSRKLDAVAKTLDLGALPSRFILELTVDAQGKVISARLSQPCGAAGRDLERAALGWELKAWSLQGSTTLKLPIVVLL